MTAVALRWADDRLGPADLLEGYRAYVDALPVNTRSRCARVRAARAFVHRNPDLSAWMSQATPVRLGDLHRGKAWPFLSWLILEGQLRPDVELLGKPGGTGLPTEWATRHGADRDRLIGPRERLSSAASLTRNCLATPRLSIALGRAGASAFRPSRAAQTRRAVGRPPAGRPRGRAA
jgi:hypothetical protein